MDAASNRPQQACHPTHKKKHYNRLIPRLLLLSLFGLLLSFEKLNIIGIAIFKENSLAFFTERKLICRVTLVKLMFD